MADSLETIYAMEWSGVLTCILQQGILHDVEFLFDDKDIATTLKAHKLILALRSPVFNRMFYGDMCTKNSCSNGTIQVRVEDMSPESFTILLKHMYTSEVAIKDVQVGKNEFDREKFLIEILYGAKKYILPSLQTQVIALIHEEINFTNAFYFFQQSVAIYSEIGEKLCLQILAANGKAFIHSPSFLILKPQDVFEFISRDDLVVPEMDIMAAILKWTSHNYVDLTSPNEVRCKLGPIFDAIRFPLMPLLDFNSCIIKHKFLSPEEINEILLMHTYLPDLSRTKFCKRPRRNRTQDSQMFADIYNSCLPNKYNCDEVTLKFCGRLILFGICLLKPTDDRQQTPLIRVLIKQNQHVLIKQKFEVEKINNAYSFLPVEFGVPILINAKALDIIAIKIEADPCYMSKNGHNKDLVEKRFSMLACTFLNERNEINMGEVTPPDFHDYESTISQTEKASHSTKDQDNLDVTLLNSNLPSSLTTKRDKFELQNVGNKIASDRVDHGKVEEKAALKPLCPSSTKTAFSPFAAVEINDGSSSTHVTHDQSTIGDNHRGKETFYAPILPKNNGNMDSKSKMNRENRSSTENNEFDRMDSEESIKPMSENLLRFPPSNLDYPVDSALVDPYRYSAGSWYRGPVNQNDGRGNTGDQTRPEGQPSTADFARSFGNVIRHSASQNNGEGGVKMSQASTHVSDNLINQAMDSAKGDYAKANKDKNLLEDGPETKTRKSSNGPSEKSSNAMTYTEGSQQPDQVESDNLAKLAKTRKKSKCSSGSGEGFEDRGKNDEEKSSNLQNLPLQEESKEVKDQVKFENEDSIGEMKSADMKDNSVEEAVFTESNVKANDNEETTWNQAKEQRESNVNGGSQKVKKRKSSKGFKELSIDSSRENLKLGSNPKESDQQNEDLKIGDDKNDQNTDRKTNVNETGDDSNKRYETIPYESSFQEGTINTEGNRSKRNVETSENGANNENDTRNKVSQPFEPNDETLDKSSKGDVVINETNANENMNATEPPLMGLLAGAAGEPLNEINQNESQSLRSHSIQDGETRDNSDEETNMRESKPETNENVKSFEKNGEKLEPDETGLMNSTGDHKLENISDPRLAVNSIKNEGKITNGDLHMSCLVMIRFLEMKVKHLEEQIASQTATLAKVEQPNIENSPQQPGDLAEEEVISPRRAGYFGPGYTYSHVSPTAESVPHNVNGEEMGENEKIKELEDEKSTQNAIENTQEREVNETMQSGKEGEGNTMEKEEDEKLEEYTMENNEEEKGKKLVGNSMEPEVLAVAPSRNLKTSKLNRRTSVDSLTEAPNERRTAPFRNRIASHTTGSNSRVKSRDISPAPTNTSTESSRKDRNYRNFTNLYPSATPQASGQPIKKWRSSQSVSEKSLMIGTNKRFPNSRKAIEGAKSKNEALAPSSRALKQSSSYSVITANGPKTRTQNLEKPPTAYAERASRPSIKHSDSIPRWDPVDHSIRMRLKGRALNLYPPSSFFEDGESTIPQAPSSPIAPAADLKLDWVYGYQGKRARSNLYLLGNGNECVYFVAAVAVCLDLEKLTQRHYIGHTDEIKCIALHPEGRIVATGQITGLKGPSSEDTSSQENFYKAHVRIWDSCSLETLAILSDSFDKAISCLAFSRMDGGKILAIADDSEYHIISLWDWNEQRCLLETRTGPNQVLTVRFSSVEPQLLVSCGKSHLTFWIISAPNGNGNDRDNAPASNNTNANYQYSITGTNATFDKHTRPKFVICIEFTEDGNVLTGDSNGSLTLWSKDDITVLKMLPNIHPGGLFTIIVTQSSNGQSVESNKIDLSTSIINTGGRDKIIKTWNAKTLELSSQTTPLDDTLGSIRVISPGIKQDWLLIGTTKNCVLHGHFERGFNIVVQGHTDPVVGLSCHPTSNQIITCGTDGQIRLWDSVKHSCVFFREITEPATAACFYPEDGTLINVATSTGGWVVLDLSNKDIVCQHSNSTASIACNSYSQDGKYLAVGSHDTRIYVYSVSDKGRKYHHHCTFHGHSAKITHLDWSLPYESKILQRVEGETRDIFLRTNAADYELLFWDPRQKKQLKQGNQLLKDASWASQNCVITFETIGIWSSGYDATDINACARNHNPTDTNNRKTYFDPSGLLLTGDDFARVRLFPYPTYPFDKGNKAKTYIGHGSHVTNVQFTADDNFAISAGGKDCSVMQWKISSG